jgi:two-component system, cell cycle response regulator DivK
MKETEPDLVFARYQHANFGRIRGLAADKRPRRFCRLPVLAVTAYAMKEDREKIVAARFDSYVSKPINAAALLQELQRLIKRFCDSFTKTPRI